MTCSKTDHAQNVPTICADYPPIGSLAAIGDGHSLALVATDGTLEWLCPRRFDAPPLLWSLLDRQRGGWLRVGALKGTCRSRYRGDTAVLEQDWQGAEGRCKVTLCMRWPSDGKTQSLLWLVEGIDGHVPLQVKFFPRPDFGRSPAQARSSERSAELRWQHQRLRFQASCALLAHGDGWRGETTVAAGERIALCLDLGAVANAPAAVLSADAVATDISATTRAWQTWSARLDWQGRYREAVVRSAITLKLLIYQPTGAVVAAGTTSLPEDPGGERNWDYRFTWLRDAGLTLSALFALGCRNEAHSWAHWMESAIERHGMPLCILYDLDGQIAQSETRLAGIEGYCASQPVRLGNAAKEQHQLDTYGELLQCVYICDTMNDDALHAHWDHMRSTADYIAAHWREPDQGIWEVRSAPRQFVHSKVMAWSGLQRALWLQRRHGLQADAATWQHESDALRAQVLRHGLSADGHYFVRAYGEHRVDCSLLLLARSGFVSGRSTLFRNTVRAVRQTLQTEECPWLLRRYHGEDPDGLAGPDGAFVICSFWLVDALVATGELAEAEKLFEQLLARQGEHGLYAEEIDPRNGRQLGNFPQAYSHVGLINAALRLCRGTSIPGQTAPFPSPSSP